MAIFHCQAKAISRAAGRSATAAAAYRAGVCLKDERTGEIHDYSRKKGIKYSEIIMPDGNTITREQLWNAAEIAEKRKDAKVAREWELALSLRDEAAKLQAEVTFLEAKANEFSRKAGNAVLSYCGEQGRICIRVDEMAGRYGKTQNGELFMIIYGY